MADNIKFLKKPKLKNPNFVAAWPGMGNVAINAVNYLKNKLGAKPLGGLSPEGFFSSTGAVVSKQIVKPPEAPSNKFYYYKAPSSDHDILFFIGSVQPIPHKEYEFGVSVLNIAKIFGIKNIYTTAAAPSDMYFKNEPRVFAVPNNSDQLKLLMEYGVHFMGDGNIAGLNGLLISIAAEMGIQGTCLLGEIPFFTAQIEFPSASLAVLDILTKLLKVEIDMVDLELYANQKEKEIEPLAALLSSQNPDEESSSLVDQVVPKKEDKVPRSVRLKVEKLFRQAEFDQTYKSKMRLKEELDRFELFEEYLDRFLDLFKKSQGES